MWVTDSANNKIYAYKMSDKSRDQDKDISLEPLVESNTLSDGIWSDVDTLWIANDDDDDNNDKIFAYKLNKEASLYTIDCREETEEFNTLIAANNENLAGIYSNGSTMWIVNSVAKKRFAYNQPLSANDSLKSLSLSGVYSGAQLFQSVLKAAQLSMMLTRFIRQLRRRSPP